MAYQKIMYLLTAVWFKCQMFIDRILQMLRKLIFNFSILFEKVHSYAFNLVLRWLLAKLLIFIIYINTEEFYCEQKRNGIKLNIFLGI